MAIWSDINSFPETGFPVLTDETESACVNTLNLKPLRASGFLWDINGKVRTGAFTSTGVVTAAGVAAGGAISGATSIAASGTVTLSSASAPLTLSGASAVLSISGLTGKIILSGQNAEIQMTGIAGRIGTPQYRIPYGYFKNLEITENPTVGGVPLASIGDLVSRYLPYTGANANVNIGSKDLSTTGAVKAVHKAADGTAAVADGTYTMGLGTATNGTITIKDGIITAVTQCTDA